MLMEEVSRAYSSLASQRSPWKKSTLLGLTAVQALAARLLLEVIWRGLVSLHAGDRSCAQAHGLAIHL